MSTLRKVMYHRPRDEEDEPPPPPSLLHWDRGVCVCVCEECFQRCGHIALILVFPSVAFPGSTRRGDSRC